jgi:hypothetical protein
MKKQCLRASVVLGLVLLAYRATAEASRCTHDQEIAAETVTDYIDSWKNMYIAFKQFSQCKDEGIAEGFSEADARLMANHWSRLSDALPLIQNSGAFRRFVIKHLDKTDANADLMKIDHLARTSCPAAASGSCAEIHAHLK